MLDEIQWGDLWIAGDADTVVQFDHSPARVAEVTPLVGGANAKVSDRGNTSNQLTVGVLREHANVSAARNFMMAHAATIEALVQTTSRDLLVRYKALPVSEYRIKNAALTTYPSKQKGVSTIHTYTFVGEQIQ